MIFPLIWIALAIFIIFVIINYMHIYKILSYLEQNYQNIYPKYNPAGISKIALFFLPRALLEFNIDVLFTKKLSLDETLKKMVVIHRILAIIILPVIIALIYSIQG